MNDVEEVKRKLKMKHFATIRAVKTIIVCFFR